VRVTYSNLAAAYAQAGKLNEAKAALAEARSRNPELTVKWVKEHGPNLPALFDGLRRAGCRRSELKVKAACGSGCDARGLSTGRSIRA
jgi:pentatricopeptide repeat protein